MNREITMEAVFRAGFRAAYKAWMASEKVGAPGEDSDEEEMVKKETGQQGMASKMYLAERSQAWQDYVKELESSGY